MSIAVVEANALTRDALIVEGQQLRVPVAAGVAPTATGSYTVVAGDTLSAIAAAHGTTVGAQANSTQTQLNGAKAAFSLSNKVYFSTTAGKLNVAVFSAGAAGAPWEGSGFNSWFNASTMTGAFYRNGRIYYTLSGSNAAISAGNRSFGEPELQTLVNIEYQSIPQQQPVILDEKKREDLVRTLVDGFTRFGYADACNPTRLRPILQRVGLLPEPHRPTLSDYAAVARTARPSRPAPEPLRGS